MTMGLDLAAAAAERASTPAIGLNPGDASERTPEITVTWTGATIPTPTESDAFFNWWFDEDGPESHLAQRGFKPSETAGIRKALRYPTIDGLFRHHQVRVEAVSGSLLRVAMAARELRAAQVAYMADRGNEEKGAAVGLASRTLDDVLNLEAPLP